MLILFYICINIDSLHHVVDDDDDVDFNYILKKQQTKRFTFSKQFTECQQQFSIRVLNIKLYFNFVWLWEKKKLVL